MKIGITGCTGRIGSYLIRELQSGAHEGLELAGGTVRALPDQTPEYFLTTDARELFEKSDAIIDFTSPHASVEHTKLAAELGKILILATSGLSDEQNAIVEEAAQKAPIVYASNTSVGVNMLMALVQQAAARLGGESWDAEIIDIHHRYKVDAPSGTSYALADAVKEGRKDENAPLVHSREGHTGAREEGSIGFSVQRGGDNTIENSVIFFGNGERLELTHRATDRAIFAKGALRAASWAAGQKPGLYSMRDVLGI